MGLVRGSFGPSDLGAPGPRAHAAALRASAPARSVRVLRLWPSCLAAAALLLLLPAAAWACPQCAGKADGGMAQYIALGLFVTFPFAVAAVVVRIVKRGDGGRAAPESSSGPGPVGPELSTVHSARREPQ